MKINNLKIWFNRIFVGKFKYKYEYYSPFGECWSVYRLWFGFIPVEYIEMVYDNMFDTTEIKKYVDELNYVEDK